MQNPAAIVVRARKTSMANNIVSYAYLLPWLAFLVVFTIYPLVYGLAMSLFNVTYRVNVFVGLANFAELLGDTMFWNAIAATLNMCAIIIPGTVVLSLWIAWTIHARSKTLKSSAKFIFYLTSVVSQVALAIAWKFMFNPAYGLSATITEALGVPRLDWLGSSSLAIPLVSALVMTFAISQPIILFASALDGIPRDFYEVAQLEGATQGQQFWKVTLPLIRPTMTFVLVTATIGNLQVFVVPYLMTGGGPNYRTTTMLYMIYRNAFEFGRYGYAAAMGIILFAIIGLLVCLQYRLVNTSEQY